MIGKRIMLLNARQIHQALGKKRVILLAIEDITVRKEGENKINALLVEKDLILKEVHHRIKNNMNTISGLLFLQAETLEDPIAIAALYDTESRVKSMMVLYDKLYRSSDYTCISIDTYLSALIDEIIGNFPNREILTVEKNICGFILDAKHLQVIGIILNELLTNIMKYAFEGKDSGLISVTATLNDGCAVIAVQDNGNGIPEEIGFEHSSGFGLMLVRTLTAQLGGTIMIERNGGTRVVLEFPVIAGSA